MKNQKIYRVVIGLAEVNNDVNNFDSKNVVATDVLGAMKKVRLKKNEYYQSVEFIHIIDKL